MEHAREIADEQSLDDEQWHALVEAIVSDGPIADPGDRFVADAGSALAAAPSVGLVRALDTVDPQRLSPADAVAYLRATERAVAWLQGTQAHALVAIAGPLPRIDEHRVDDGIVTIEDAGRSEVAAAARWSEAMAHDRITTARLLGGPLRRTGLALLAGDLTYRHAESIAASAGRLSSFAEWLAGGSDDSASFAAACAELESAVLPTACRRDVSSTRRRAERALHRIDAEHAARRRRQAQRHRDVWVEVEEDGLAVLKARMGVAQAQACLSAVDSLARDPRLPLAAETPADATIGERRAEALAWLLLRAAGSPADQSAHVRTHVDIVIDLSTLLALDDQPATMVGNGPGGPTLVDPHTVRSLVAADPTATMRRLIREPLTGHLLDRGRTVYSVPEALRAFLVMRDGECRFPGCHRRAGLGQVDHAQPWRDSGTTSRANLGVLCVRHHQLKTHSGWRIVQSADDGSCRWRSPAGVEYEHPPPRLLSDG